MDNKRTILIVEDDPGIGNFIRTVLTAAGYGVLHAEDGAAAMMMISSHCPDLILLDLGLPDMDGAGIIRAVRQWSHMPVLVVSARTQESDKIAALDLGADDYITKPFGSGELLARIRTALRHAAGSGGEGPSGVFRTGELRVDYGKMRVTIRGADAHLTRNEYRIVELLSRNAGRVLTYDRIIRSVWGPNCGGGNQILRVNMANIRRKLEENPADPLYFFTETGVGYRMAEGD